MAGNRIASHTVLHTSTSGKHVEFVSEAAHPKMERVTDEGAFSNGCIVDRMFKEAVRFARGYFFPSQQQIR
jgi:hypothetical protein